MFDVMTYYLSNGMRVMLHREPNTRVVKVGVVINQGSMHETDNDNGISHFLEHMIFAQYENNPKIREYLEKLYTYGASYNATTYKANTMYYISGLADGIMTYLALLRDLVFKAKAFEEETLIREKQVVERELVSYYSSFNQIADRSIQALFGEHNIGRIIVGKKENVRNFSMEQLNQKVREAYSPSNAAIVVFGDIDYYEIEKTINELYGGLDEGKSKIHFEPVQSTPSIYINPKYKGEHSIVSVCYRMVTNNDPILTENVMMLLLGSMCDPTLAKRIAYDLRMTTGLSYKVGGFMKHVNSLYASGVTAVAKGGDIPEVVKIMLDHFDKIRDLGFEEEELIKIKKNVVYRKLAAKSDMSTQADVLLNMAMNPFIYSPENEIRIIENLSLEDVNKCINEILNPENFGLACIGDCNIDEIVSKFVI